MSPHALRAGGVALGIVLGLLGARVADRLPSRYGITHLVTGAKRARRNAVVVVLVTLIGAAIGELVARAMTDVGLEPWHASAILGVNLLVASAVVAAAAIDLEHMILPDELTLGGALVCLLSSPIRNVGWRGALIGAAVGLAVAWVPFAIYKRLRGHSGMGLGDAKLAILAGAWFGPIGAVLVLFGGVALMPLAAFALRAAGAPYQVPESVQADIAELRARAEAGDEEAARELEDDPMAADVADGALSARMPLGPFLALACLVLLFTRRYVEPWLLAWLSG